MEKIELTDQELIQVFEDLKTGRVTSEQTQNRFFHKRSVRRWK